MRRRPRRLLLTAVLGGLMLAGCTASKTAGSGSGTTPAPASTSLSPGVHAVELIYLDHPPIQPVIADVETVLTRYAGRVAVTKLQADSPDGERRAKDLGLGGHIALIIAIDGSTQAQVGGHTVRFEGFPSGKSPIESAQGSWSIADLDAALAQRTG